MSFGYGFSLPGWYTTSGGFPPAQLFTGGVQGAWYDPSDITTLFQDSAGTTPVTAVEQAVGLMLDKSKGLVLSANVLSASWTVSAGATASGSSVTLNSASDVFAYQDVMTSGLRYFVTFDYNITSGQTGLYVGSNGGSGDTILSLSGLSGTGTYSGYFRASNTTFIFRDNSGCVASFTNITLRVQQGNHAYQTTSASRPTLRARYNLLTRSEEFDDAAWTKQTGGSITATNSLAPDGTNTADTWTQTGTPGTANIFQNATIVANSSNTFSISVKKITGQYCRVVMSDAGNNNYVIASFDLDTPQATEQLAIGTGATITSATIVPQNNGYYCLTIVGTIGGGYTLATASVFVPSASTGGTRLANGSCLLWGAQLVPTAVFPSNTYQRIGAATDYATGAAFPPYLFFDGTDDSMLTNSVDFATVTSDGQARRNLLLNPTQFDAAGWTAVASLTVTANSTTAPDNTTTADTLTNPASGYIQQTATTTTVVNTFSVYLKAGTTTSATVQGFDSAYWARATFNLSNGTITSVLNGSASISDAGNGWYRCIVTGTPNSSSTTVFVVPQAVGNCFAWGAQLETGSTATAFQNIGTDRMLVVAGVTKSSDAAFGMVAELGNNAPAGSFWVLNGDGAVGPGPQWQFLSTGATTRAYATATAASPITNVFTGVGDIGAPLSRLRLNGVQVANTTTAQGVTNYGNYPLYIGRRNNATLPFNGNIYSLVIAGAAYSAGQISSTESWVAAKTPLGTI